MLILVPVDSSDEKGAKITTIPEMKQWALIDFDEGETKSIRFFDDRTQTGEEWIDFVILKNKFENYLEFMDEGMMVLVVRQEETLEDILNAFKFKELDEIGL